MVSRLLDVGERSCVVYNRNGLQLFASPDQDAGTSNGVANHLLDTMGYPGVDIRGASILAASSDAGDPISLSRPVIKRLVTGLPHHLRSHPPDKKQGPRQPKRSFWYFIGSYHSIRRKEMVKNGEKPSFTQLVKDSRMVWSQMTDTDKAEYEELARIDRMRYEAEYAVYRRLNPLPPTRPINAYKFYLRTPGTNPTPWRQLCATEKRPYMELAAEDQERYVKELQSFREWCHTNGIDYDERMSRTTKRQRVIKPQVTDGHPVQY